MFSATATEDYHHTWSSHDDTEGGCEKGMVLSRHVMNAERVAEMQERAEFQAVKHAKLVNIMA